MYSFGALLLVLGSHHDPAALVVFTVLTGATVFIAWRTDAICSSDGGRLACCGITNVSIVTQPYQNKNVATR